MTNPQGQATFYDTPPGKYTISINFFNAPTQKAPFPSVFAPGVEDRLRAEVFEIYSGTQISKKIEIRVPRSLEAATLSGTVIDERGNPVAKAGPATPVQILGLAGVPAAGDQLIAMDALRATEIAQTRQRLEREKRMRIKSRGLKLTDISKMLAKGETQHLGLVIKGDVDGSVQALSDSLEQLSTPEVRVEVIHRGVGAINESDVLLASTAAAISSESPARRIGMCFSTASRFTGSSIHARLIGVTVAPGPMPLTRIPCAAYSSASVWVRFCMPPLDTE